MYANKKRSRSRTRTRKATKGRSSASGKGWRKVGGKWVRVGARKPAKSRTRKAPSRGSRCRDDQGHFTSCKGSRKATRGRAKARTKKAWPKKGSKAMRRAVAGVDARVTEDLLKAQKLVQSARFRIRKTSKASGSKSKSPERCFSTAVKAIETLIRAV